ncbi:uncharacterized protein G2W53_004038 [Senna tora]|uniref:Uncharacterized protein n=1 Tax=Senna tora TaxID=362788 RepID=A0A835CIZ1_9FABA|nr:uncharacterized protein G2W53_004038 [Senna tora]
MVLEGWGRVGMGGLGVGKGRVGTGGGVRKERGRGRMEKWRVCGGAMEDGMWGGWGVRFGGVGWVWKIDGVGGGVDGVGGGVEGWKAFGLWKMEEWREKGVLAMEV